MKKIAIIGIGYVGLPLARLFSTKYPVIGYDINLQRINELNNCKDSLNELSENIIKKELVHKNPFNNNLKNGLYFTNNLNDIKQANIYIITIPTPIYKNKKPDLRLLFKATRDVGKFLNKKDIVIYESTVYPGLTEEECVPILEKESKLIFNKNFYIGYSPERINPGDKKRTIDKILKITSGSNKKTALEIDKLYKSVIKAGTYLAPSIKIAEAAKIIENTQRDINIAFINELSKIFNLLNINTEEVLKAASTKWNFLNFKPGLVGGHCIGVDPYYLSKKSQDLGYNPKIILAGRKLNDSMGEYVVSQVVKLMIKKSIKIKNSKILILGIAFKENCNDIRNSKVFDIIKNFEEYDIKTTIFDPLVLPSLVKENNYKIKNLNFNNIYKKNKYDAIVLAVNHKIFKNFNYKENLKKNSVLYDVKRVLKNKNIDGGL